MSRTTKLFVLTSCTGEKAVEDLKGLTLADFRKGPAHIRERERLLKDKLTPAESLYSGMQHVRLMRGIAVARTAPMGVDLKIVSAGYGVVEPDRKIAPYEATFIGMGKAALHDWARQLDIPKAVRTALAVPNDLALVLLGDDYLTACELDDKIKLGGPTLVFCGKASAAKLPKLPNLHPVLLSNADAKRFSCGMVGLKGEVVARVLEAIAGEPKRLVDFVADAQKAVGKLAALTIKAGAKGSRQPMRANPNVDRVIEIPQSWWDKPHRRKLSYFIPDWDDQVDPDFDFTTESHSGGTGGWENQVYAHQMFKEPNYDGILISKVVAEKSKKKAERINRLGVHRYLRIPRHFPVMGDCGAFGYINDYEPPFKTTEILDYYTRLDFDYGVSIDHFAIGEGADRKRRYDLTIENARNFIVEHKKLGLSWTPIGAVQGWDEASFSRAAKQYRAMGYKYIAVGAMVRRRTPEILSIIEQVRKVISPEMQLHLFGVARLNAISELVKVGVNSADSASCLRKAWLGGSGNNYLTIDGLEYAAIRIPEAEGSFRAKRIVSDGRASLDQVVKLERACIDAVHGLDRGQSSVEHVLDILHEYDQLITPDRQDNREHLRRTLEAKPWKSCPCEICQTVGVDVAIFRGNNRNRRRGFHNTYAFYHLLQRLVGGETIPSFTRNQLELSIEFDEAA